MGALSNEQKNKRNADFNALFNSLTPVPSADTSGTTDSGAADTGVAADTGTAPVSTGAGTTTTVSTTTAPKTELEKAAERAAEIESRVPLARLKAEADVSKARVRAERSTLDDEQLMLLRLREAEKKAAADVKRAEESVQTKLPSGRSRSGSVIGVPKLTGFGKDREPVDVIRSAARIIAKRQQVKNAIANAEDRRTSRIAELTKRMSENPRVTSQAKTNEAAARTKEIEELTLQINNLNNLDESLKAIYERTLGDPSIAGSEAAAKAIVEEKAKLENQPADFDPERGR